MKALLIDAEKEEISTVDVRYLIADGVSYISAGNTGACPIDLVCSLLSTKADSEIKTDFVMTRSSVIDTHVLKRCKVTTKFVIWDATHIFVGNVLIVGLRNYTNEVMDCLLTEEECEKKVEYCGYENIVDNLMHYAYISCADFDNYNEIIDSNLTKDARNNTGEKRYGKSRY